MPDTIFKDQVGWQFYRIWYETERIHESLDYQTPQALAEHAIQGVGGCHC